MTPQELKNSVLQRAIQGKLVEQRPEEGTGEELYQAIQAEKRRLIKSGQLKKEKPSPEITEDEIPFDIPDSWKWVRLAEIGAVIGGGTPKTENAAYWDKNGIPWLTPADMKFISGKYAERGERNISKVGLENSSAKLMPKGTILYSSRAPIGYIAIAANNISTNQGFKSLVPTIMDTNEFIYYSLIARTSDIISRASGTTFKEISGTEFGLTLIPLPPLAEQRRIVSKIEELVPYIDRYTAAWNRLEAFNTRFPSDMRKSLLQIAIQGKLVEQRPEEGTGEELYRTIQAEKQRLIKSGKIKKEKPLPEITDDEIPFEIPDSWKWVRFGQIIDVRDGTHGTPTYVQNGLPLVTSKNLIDGRIDFQTAKMISMRDADEINARSYVDNGDILFAMIGTIGNPVLVEKDREFCIKNMALFKPVNQGLFDMRYLLLFLQNEQYVMKRDASGGVQSFVSLRYLRNYPLPLPPLAEQRRIVARLQELLPLCGRLE